MKSLLSLFFVLLGSLSAQTAPYYFGVYEGVGGFVGLNPPFSPTTTYNTVVYGPMNPTSNPDTVLTDKAWNCGKPALTATQLSEGNLTASAAPVDNMASLPLPDGSIYIGVHLNGANCILHIAFDPITGAAKNITNGGGENGVISVPGVFGFSKVSPTTFYWQKDNLLHQGTITSDTAYTETKNAQFPFDWDTCPASGVAPGTVPKSLSVLNIAAYDRQFAMNLSWTGGQGSAKFIAAYQPGVGCASLDLAPLGTASTYGNAYDFTGKLVGTETACVDPNGPLGQGIHDTEMSNDGRVVSVAGAAWLLYGAGNMCFWEVATTNALSIPASNNGIHMSGHQTMNAHQMFFMDPPHPNIRTIWPLTQDNLSQYQVLATIPNMPAINSMHGAQAHPDLSDWLPWVVESAGVSPDPRNPLPFVNEIFGIQPFLPNAPVLRFGTTWNTTVGTMGGCSVGIGFISQDGQHWFYLSDGLQSFGQDANGKPLCLLMSKTL